jgi:hypothetical protein
MDGLTMFGFISVAAMLVTYAAEDHSPWCILAFAITCLMSSVYGFLAETPPFAFVEGVWFLVALRRWRLTVTGRRTSATTG